MVFALLEHRHPGCGPENGSQGGGLEAGGTSYAVD